MSFCMFASGISTLLLMALVPFLTVVLRVGFIVVWGFHLGVLESFDNSLHACFSSGFLRIRFRYLRVRLRCIKGCFVISSVFRFERVSYRGNVDVRPFKLDLCLNTSDHSLSLLFNHLLDVLVPSRCFYIWRGSRKLPSRMMSFVRDGEGGALIAEIGIDKQRVGVLLELRPA